MGTDGMYKPNYALLFEKCHYGDVNYIRQNCTFETINVCNQSGVTLLALACLDDNEEMVQELLKFLPNINIKTTNGHSAATFAISNNNLKNLKLLVENNDKFDFKDNKIVESTLLAITRGHEEIVNYLISKGLDTGSSDQKNNNILMYASRYGLDKICLASTLKIMNINSRNSNQDTALLIAVENNHNLCVDILINAGAQINIQNRKGETALMIAIRLKNQVITKKLIEQKDVIINAQDSNGHNALMDAVLNNDLTITYMLLRKPEIDIELVNKYNQSALMIAIKNDFEEIASLLLKVGASQRGVDNFNLSCLDYAKKNRNGFIIKSLTQGEDRDLENIKNKIIAKLNQEIQNIEDSIQEIIFADINQLSKKEKQEIEKFKTSKIEFKPVDSITKDLHSSKNDNFIPRFSGEKKLNQILLNSQNIPRFIESKDSLRKNIKESKDNSLKTQRIIESQLSNNLIEQLEKKYKIKVEEKDLESMNFKDIILSSAIRKKPKKENRLETRNKIDLIAMKSNEE